MFQAGNVSASEQPGKGEKMSNKSRTFISCTLQDMTRNIALDNTDLTVDDARAFVMAGVMSGPEFLDEGDESDRYRAKYFFDTALETLSIDVSTAQRVIRPWESETVPRIGDHIVYFSINRSSGEVNLHLLTVVSSSFVG
jgi:hypothetical protein